MRMPEQLQTEATAKTIQRVAPHDPQLASPGPQHGASHSNMLQLQRILGNRCVTRLIQAKRITAEGTITGIQRKLTVGAADDQYEREADHIARQIVNMPDSAVAESSRQRSPLQESQPQTPQVQPHPSLQDAKFSGAPPLPQRQAVSAVSVQRASAGLSEAFDAGDEMESQLDQSKGQGSPLPDAVREYMEPRFGADFQNVRVHTGNNAIQMNRAIGAQAFTHGSDIFFGGGSNPANLELTAHELTHVLQQTGAAEQKNPARKIQRDTCSNSDSDEARFAGQNEGKVFKSGDNPKEPTEVILWNFCVGESQLREQHKLSLKQDTPRWKGLLVGTATSPATRPELRIKIKGTASGSGNKTGNEKIGLERAESLKSFLESEGIPASFITVEGVGSTLPLADETSAENMARNRRVELFFFTPTVTADITGALVAANVKKIAIGPQSAPVPPPSFNKSANMFSRVVFAMTASADVDLVGFGGDSIGFYQLLTGDQRIALYTSEKDGSELLLDYGRCNTVLPCRDVLDATSSFSIDNRSLVLASTSSVSGTVRISDRPGTGFPLRYPDPVQGPFVLSRYFWKMDFDLILGVRSGGLLMPLRSAVWNLAAAEDVDVAKQTTSGMAPVSVHQSFATVTAADKKDEMDNAFAGPTCRLMARSREIVPEERPCRPVES